MSNIGFKVNLPFQENLIRFSEEFNNQSYWNSTAYPCSITPNAIVDPFGGNNASFIAGNASTISLITAAENISEVTRQSKICSVYAKLGTCDFFTLNCMFAGDTEVNVTFALTNGTTDSPAISTIVPVGNGWYRCAIQVPSSAIRDTFLYRIWPNGRGLITTSGTYFFGAQVSNGSNLQDYIRTYNIPLASGYPDSPDIGDLLVSRDIFTEGGLWLTGYNAYGQLGDNSTINRSSPVQTICGGTNWKSVSRHGIWSTAAIKTDGTLWTWGHGGHGTLGNNLTDHKSSPVQTICGGNNWKQVDGGSNYKAAIKTDGTLWTWGNMDHGRLGDNAGNYRSSPVQTICGGNNWKQVSCGYWHCTAIKTDGTLWLWGYNTTGCLGDNSVLHKSSPVQTIAGGTNWKFVAGGAYITGAIKTDGTLWTWGDNPNGELGDNTVINRSSPVQTIANSSNWKTLDCHSSMTAIKTDGTLWSWGNNQFGGIGDNTLINRSSPVQTICGGTNWKQVIIDNGVYAIKTDGTLWTWGLGDDGALGVNTSARRSSPVQTIVGGNNWKSVGGSTNGLIAIKEIS